MHRGSHWPNIFSYVSSWFFINTRLPVFSAMCWLPNVFFVSSFLNKWKQFIYSILFVSGSLAHRRKTYKYSTKNTRIQKRRNSGDVFSLMISITLQQGFMQPTERKKCARVKLLLDISLHFRGLSLIWHNNNILDHKQTPPSEGLKSIWTSRNSEPREREKFSARFARGDPTNFLTPPICKICIKPCCRVMLIVQQFAKECVCGWLILWVIKTPR